MKNKLVLITIIAASSLTACTNQVPKTAYFNRGQPESLLQVTDNVQRIDISTRSGIAQLSNAIKSGTPTSAVLTCSNDILCNQAAGILDSSKVAYDRQRGVGNSVALSFKEVQARNCESAFIDNHVNPYNLNHPTFGCSVAVNQVQMVSDKRQFTDPLLLGPYDGQKAAQDFDSYLSRGSTSAQVQAPAASSAASSSSE